MTTPGLRVAVVGATGLVGAEIVNVLAERQFPLTELRLYASDRSAGDTVRCGTLDCRVELLDQARFTDVDVIFLAAPEAASAAAGRMADAGAVIIDTTQRYVADDTIPLVVPEVNADAVTAGRGPRVLASPDPVGIALAVALAPLQAAAGLRSVVATTYEPASTSGRAGVEELQRETVELLHGRSPGHEVFPQRLAFNAVPHIGDLPAGGASSAEDLAARALRRLLSVPALAVSLTRVRIPTFFGVGVALTAELGRCLDAAEVREILRAAPGCLLVPESGAGEYLTPADTVGEDAVCIGRVRTADEPPRLSLWLTIDNLRKGSAVNAVQIAELLARHRRA